LPSMRNLETADGKTAFITLAVFGTHRPTRNLPLPTPYAAIKSSGRLPPWCSSAQAMQVILLASATATTLKRRRANSCVSHGYLSGCAWRVAAWTPMTRMTRRVVLHRNHRQFLNPGPAPGERPLQRLARANPAASAYPLAALPARQAHCGVLAARVVFGN
jgi:hypothetical protein